MITPISFKGTFCITKNNLSDTKKSEKILSHYDKYQMTIDRIEYRDKINETHFTINDKYDNKFKKLLETLKIPFEYFNVNTRLDRDEIHSRIGIDELDEKEGIKLVEADTNKLYTALKNQGYFDHMNSEEDQMKFERFKRFLHTKHKIEAPIIYFIIDREGEIVPQILDGRHRLVVLRNLGLKTIPVCLSQTSIKMAKLTDIFNFQK